MINLSLNELKLIAQIRNTKDYENKSKEDLIKALSESDPKPNPKSELKTKPKSETPKPETKPKQTPKRKPKQTAKTKPKSEPKMEIKVNRKKLEKLRKDFDELRHKFSNKDEIKDIEKLFIMLKNTTFCIRNRGGKKKS